MSSSPSLTSVKAVQSVGAWPVREHRAFNYSAGPGCMPDEVLRQIQEDVWNCRRSGVGILEHSHRAPVYDRILAEALEDCRTLGGIPNDQHILFMTGGSTQQNFQVPMNFLAADGKGSADYFNTGYWSNRSVEDAKIFGAIHEAASSRPDNYTYIPDASQVRYSKSPTYVHYTSNNTIFGIQHHGANTPSAPAGAFLACDMCSDIFSRPVDWSRHGFIYASAQKNLGPAGATMVVIRDDVMKMGRRDIAHMLQYRTFAEAESRPNTPPVFPIYAMGLMFKWMLRECGSAGLEHFATYNRDKAKVIYDVLDQSVFYKPHARPDSRSLMNITFRCPTPALDDRFCALAAEHGLDCLKGHRATGGMRASLYNAMPMQGATVLAQFMVEFERTHG
jgi:phosphoserine aminotransferase